MKSVSFSEEGNFLSFWFFFDIRLKRIRRDCQNGIIRVYENTLTEVFSWRKNVCSTSWGLEREISGFCRNVLSDVVKSALCVCLGTVWGKIFVPWKTLIMFLSSIFGLCLKFFRHFVKNFSALLSQPIFVSLRTFRGKTFNFRENISVF